METDAERDVKLLILYRETGDAAALEEIIGRHYDFLYRLAVRVCGNDRDAEDIVQQALAAVLKQIQKYSDTGSVRSWLGGFVVNYCRLFKRTRRRKQKNEEALRRDVEHAGTAVAQAASADDEELKSALRQTVEELPGEYRVPLTLYYYEKMTAGEIGRVLGVKERTIYSRLDKAVLFLRKRMTTRGLSATEAALPTMLGAIGATDVLRRAPTHLARTAVELRNLSVGQSVKLSRLSGSFAWVSAIAVGAIALGGFATYWIGDQAAPDSAKSGAGTGAETHEEMEKDGSRQNDDSNQDFYVRWDFNDGRLPPGFKVLSGVCRVLEKGGVNDSGCLLMEDGCVLSIPVNVPSLPLIFEQSKRILMPKPKDSWSECISWAVNSGEMMVIEHFEEPLFLDSRKWKTSRLLCAENFTVGLKDDGGFHNIIVGRRKTAQTPLLFAVTGNRLFDNFIIRPAKPEEIPDIAKYVQAAEKIAPADRKGPAVLSEFPPLGGMPWTVRFLPNPSETSNQAPE